MSSVLTSKKPRAKQSTYGKQVKSHVSSWFGRNLWADRAEPAHDPTRSETSEDDNVPKSTKQVLNERKAKLETKNSEQDVISKIDSVVEGLGSLGLKEAVVPEAAAENHRMEDTLIAAKFSRERLSMKKSLQDQGKRQSSPAVRREQSNRSNKSSRKAAEITPARSIQSRTSCCGIAAPESMVLAESPTRKNGLRKRGSLSPSQRGTSSPLMRGCVGSEEVSDKENRMPPLVEGLNTKNNSTDILVNRKSIISVVIEKSSPKVEGEASTSRHSSRRKNIQAPQVSTDATKNISTPSELKKHHSSDVPKSLEESLTGHVVVTSGSERILSETEQLLQLCTTTEVINFTAQIESIMKSSTLRKLGEASYSEVFLQTPANSDSTTVLKVIPFGKEEQCEAKSILQEVRITKAMAGIEGFVGFRGAYVVQGQFPETLMELWDIYDEERGSESERPDYFEDDQLFAVIMLENGGRDLEHFGLRSWSEANDVFWQVVSTLARGEKERKFEHRDLHFGNIVIRRQRADGQDDSSGDDSESDEDENEAPEEMFNQLSLEDSSSTSTLKVALIDYTLSRARCGDLGGRTEYEFAPLDDPALFTGKGNYQYDIYRFMRTHLSSGLLDPSEECIDWDRYEPRTNVFWLHYLTKVLMDKKDLLKPTSRGKNADIFSDEEKACYRSLEAVSKAIDPRKKKFGKVQTFESAADVLEWAVEEGIMETGVASV